MSSLNKARRKKCIECAPYSVAKNIGDALENDGAVCNEHIVYGVRIVSMPNTWKHAGCGINVV
jgi:hypothetical protein